MILDLLKPAALLLAAIFVWPGYAPGDGHNHSQSERDARRQRGQNRDQADSEAGARLTSVLNLAASHSPEARSSLIADLRDPDPSVRAAAISGLANLQAKDSIPLIGEALHTDKDDFVRRQAAYALGEFQDNAATSFLLPALKDKEPDVRAAAVVGLGEFPCPSAVPALTAALRDKSAFIRAEAAHALALDLPEAHGAVMELIRMLSDDPDHNARREAARTLGLIGDSSALSSLEHASQSPDPYLSTAAISAIEAIKARENKLTQISP